MLVTYCYASNLKLDLTKGLLLIRFHKDLQINILLIFLFRWQVM